jgi:endothelin-converting enzyme/putative endopeptidase
VLQLIALRMSRLAAVLILGVGGLGIGAAHAADKPPKPTEFNGSPVDQKVSPCDDFFQYVCGPWVEKNPIPSDQSAWGQFNVLAESNRAKLHEILEEAAAHPTPETQKIGDFYAACMDEGKIEAAGTAPLKPYFDKIQALASKDALPALIADLQKDGFNVLFSFGSTIDPKDATRQIAGLDQGGLSLPDKDYYLKDDKKSVENRDGYLAHVTKMFTLLGDAPDVAAAHAKTVMTIETTLAKGALDKVSRRDPVKTYNKFTPSELIALDGAFGWQSYFDTVKAPSVETLDVTEPAFFKEEGDLLSSTSLDDIKTYLRWHVVHGAAPMLPSVFVNENFDFFSHQLSGAKVLQVRWKRCVRATDSALGEELGKAYVAKYFAGDAKARMLALVKTVIAAYHADIEKLDWMGPETKKQALIKLEAIGNKIGYPDHWRDYSKLTIDRNDALGNDVRASAFEFRRDLNKIGQPVDRSEWGMTPPTVNAYYDPQINEINFPAGILQPPFFDPTLDDAVNFGAIGLVIGHEMTHGFDDEGRQFDADGNLHDWWTEEDAKKFDAKAECLVKEYGGFTAIDDVHVNGKLTLGENTADNGGAHLAYNALMQRLAKLKEKKIDGFTPQQRFFLGFATVWCSSSTPESLRLRALTDPHSPARARVNGTVVNMPEFAKAFSCKPTDPMVGKPACRVW